MPKQRLDGFTAKLASAGLKEVDVAVALLWFVTHSEGHESDATAKEIAELIVDQRLSGTVNSSRLATNLAKHADVVRGRRKNSFRIRSASDELLTKLYRDYADLSKAPVQDLLITAEIGLGGRRTFDTLRREANGAYERGFFNSSAVMCRRLAETLLIEAFDRAGHLDSVRDANQNLLGFGDLITAATSGRFIKLSRIAPAAFSRLKQLGDGAAHHRHYLVTKKDLDDLNPGYSQLIAELAALAGLQ